MSKASIDDKPMAQYTDHVEVFLAFGKACHNAYEAKPNPNQDEDCLFGNVYVPSGTGENARLPVVVWIHGGGFEGSDSHDSGAAGLFKDTKNPFIFASFDYRLGPFGFLAGKEVASDGDLNAGLLDQRAALRWVKRYIEKFGGDKDSVTIWGVSAGAGSTMYQLMAKGGDNEGLFHQAMGDSPSLNYQRGGQDHESQALFEQYSTLAGCNGDKRLDCLRSADIFALTNASSQTKTALNRSDTIYLFNPVFDGKFLKQRATDAFKNGSFAKVPVLFGSNTDEGWIWANTDKFKAPNATNATVYQFMRAQFPLLTEETFNKAFNEYYTPSKFNNSLVQVTSSMYGESRYICTALMIDGAAFANKVPSYAYHYDNGERTIHGADTGVFFDASMKENQGLIKAMRQYFSSFQTSGKPEAENSATWDKVENSDGCNRILLRPGQVGMEQIDSDLKARCAFWRSTDTELQR